LQYFNARLGLVSLTEKLGFVSSVTIKLGGVKIRRQEWLIFLINCNKGIFICSFWPFW
jgi:hypothetical protein